MRRPNHASRFEGIAKTKLQASRASDTKTLQSQVNKAGKKRLSLSGLEILHGRLHGRTGSGALTDAVAASRGDHRPPRSGRDSSKRDCLKQKRAGRTNAARLQFIGDWWELGIPTNLSGDELTTAARQDEKTTASRDQPRQSRTDDRAGNGVEDSTAVRRGLNFACFIKEP